MGGKKSKPTIGYWYKLAIHFLIAKAIDVLLEARGGDKTAWSGFQDASGTFAIAAKNLWGGEKAEGGIEGDFELMMGDQDQMPNAYLASVFGPKNPAFRGKATGIFKGGLYGAFNPYPKPMTFKVRRIFSDWPDDACWYPAKAAIPFTDDASVSGGFPAGSSWHYKPDPTNTADYSAYDYNHTGWDYGPEPIGTPGYGSPGTLFPYTFGGSVWLRKFLSDPYATSYTFTAWADDEIWIYWNGALVYSNTGGGGVGATITMSGADVLETNSLAVRAKDHALVALICSVQVSYAGTVQGAQAMNPAHMLYESIVAPWGEGAPADLIDEPSFMAAADQLFAEGFGLCTRFDPRHQTPQDFQRRIEQIIDGRLSQSRVDGKYYLTLIRDNYVLDDLPILTDDDIIEFKEEDSDPLASVNQVMVEFFDPEAKEKRITPPINALAAIRASGGIVSETGQYPEIPYEDLALRVGARDLGYKCRPAKKFVLTTTRRPYAWNGGQLFRLQAPRRGIADMVCLLGEINAGVPRSGTIRLKASQHVSALRTAVYVTPEPGVDGSPPSTAPAISTQTILEAPYAELAGTLDSVSLAALADDAGHMLVAAKRPSGAVNYRLWSAAGSAELEEGPFGDFCGTALLSGSVDPYDTAIALTDLEDLDDVEVGSLVMLGTELARLDAIDVDAGTATLGRGCCDTTPQAHATGTRVWFLDTGSATDQQSYADGETVHAKLLSRTSSYELPIADATEITLEMASRAVRPYPPGKLRVNAAPAGAAVSETFTVSWAHRDRKLQADQLVDHEAASIGPEVNTRYTLRVVNDATEAVLVEEADLGDPSATVLLPADHAAIRVEVLAVRDGFESWQANVSPAFAYTAGAAGAAYAAANPGSNGVINGTEADPDVPTSEYVPTAGGTMIGPLLFDLSAGATSNPISISGALSGDGRLVKWTNTNVDADSSVGLELVSGSGTGTRLTDASPEYTAVSAFTGTGVLENFNAGGLSYSAKSAAGQHRWYIGVGRTLAMTLDASGNLVLAGASARVRARNLRFTIGAQWESDDAIDPADALPVDRKVDVQGTIVSACILTFGGPGSCVVNIKKGDYASWPPATNICGSSPPTIVAASKYQDTTLTGWSPSVSAGDIFRFTLASNATFKRVLVLLEIAR